MPHTNRKPAPKSNSFKPADFVNITLSKEQVAEIKASEWSLDHQDNALTRLLGSGYKLTLRFDERNDCFAAWLIPDDKMPNAGFILSGRGSTPSKAIKQLSYLHYHVFDEVWGTEDMRHPVEIDD